MKKFLFTSLFLSLFLPITFLFGKQLSPAEKIAYKVRPAVVLFENYVQAKFSYIDNSGRAVIQEMTLGSSGSGFFIHPEGYLLTSGHVVENYQIYMKDPDRFKEKLLMYFALNKMKEDNIPITGSNFNKWLRRHNPSIVSLKVSPMVTLSNNEKYIYEIKKYSPPIGENGKDIAVLKIERDNCPVLFLGDSSKAVLNQDVFAVGYPAVVDPLTHVFLSFKTRLQPSITKGVISSLKADYKGVPVIQTDVTIGHGNSGGPVVDIYGKVIGIATLGSAEVNPFGVVQEVAGFNFLIPINTAKEFVRDAGIEMNKSSEFKKTYDALFDAYWKGDYFRAKDLVIIALSYMKDQPDLERLQANILRNIENMSPITRMWKQHEVAVIVGVILVVLIFVILFVVLKPSGEEAETIKKPTEEAPTVGAGEVKGTVVEEYGGKVEIFVKGEKIGEENIAKAGSIIGRDPLRANIIISEPTISKTHCKIVPQEEDFLVVDLNSTNGTYINGKKISQEKVKIGDSIQLARKGDIILVVSK